jgi:hypothetical protein
MALPPGRKPMSPEWFALQSQDFSRVDRVEVIDNQGRAYVKLGVQEVSYTLQDDGRTLKLFLAYEEPKD